MSDWSDPVRAHKMQHRGMTFDSKLELSWYVTLDAYGFDVWDHPGRIELRAGGWWEPDLRVGDVLCEVKPWEGESVDRLWKPKAAADEHQLPVLILRPGLMTQSWDDETAGCVWESCDDLEWVVVHEHGVSKFVPLENTGGRDVLWSADQVLLDVGTRVGMTMRHWSEVR